MCPFILSDGARKKQTGFYGRFNIPMTDYGMAAFKMFQYFQAEWGLVRAAQECFCPAADRGGVMQDLNDTHKIRIKAG